MQWLEISADAKNGDTEALSVLLEELGVEGVVIEDEKDVETFLAENRAFWDGVDEAFLAARRGVSRVKFYLADDDAGRSALAALRPPLEAAGHILQVSRVRDEDWENNWKQFYKPIEVGEKLLIVPKWEKAAPAGERRVLRLDPGLIFGTGSHPSTRMCLEAMEPWAPEAARGVDLGCGSGILAIAALLLGAGSAFGCDIDEKAPRIAMENAALNGVEDRLTVLTGDATTDGALRAAMSGEGYELVFLNIVADVIIRLSRDAAAWLRPGGRLIVSGVIDGRETEVQSALEAAGLAVLSHRRLGDWHSFICTGGDQA